jgi:hypothetical protein
MHWCHEGEMNAEIVEAFESAIDFAELPRSVGKRYRK